MSTSEETPAVEGIGSEKQRNTQTQGESNTCQTNVRRETGENRLPEKQSTNDEGNRIPTHVEMWRDCKGRTLNGRRSQSTNDQRNGTTTHVEMWKERRGRTPDKGLRKGTRETEQHIRMWEGRYTPRDSGQEANTGQ